MYKRLCKPFLDFLGALILLVILFSLLIVVTIWLCFANKGASALFYKERLGKDEKILKIYKSKSLPDEKAMEIAI